jgi:anti-sigma B factor antagonist
MITGKNVDMHSIEKLLSDIGGEYISLEKGNVLYRQNDLIDGIYLVFDGNLDMINAGGSNIRKICKYEFFGIDDISESYIRTSTVTAIENTSLIKIPVTNIARHKNEIVNKNGQEESVAQKILSTKSNITSQEEAFTVNNKNGIMIVTFKEERGNLNNAVQFKNFLLDIITNGGKKLIVDLLICKTFDSTFLGSLIAVLKKISEAGGELKLVCNSDICSWLFVLTQLDQVFEIYPTLDKAVAHLENKVSSEKNETNIHI